jgi:HPt (histidine-containing phosphotransfer) domain-containing protein
MFAKRAPSLVTGILNHIHAGDADGEKGRLHGLIASANNIGARRMAHLCRYIQSSLDNGNLDDCKEWSEQLPLQLELLLDKITMIRRDDAC